MVVGETDDWFTTLAVILCLSALFTQSNAEVLRTAAWNTFNRPNDAAHAAAFTTVCDAIGDELIAGHASRFDLLAVSETDTGFSAQLPVLLNDLYGIDTYEVITSSPDGGFDRTGLVSDTDALDLIGTSK